MSNSPRNSRSANAKASVIIFKRDLAHRGSDERVALLAADQFGHFVRAAALKRNHAQTVK